MMKLNPDCIRDILLSVEDITDANTSFEYSKHESSHKRLAQYTHEEIEYHLQQCSMSKLIVDFRRYDGGALIVVGDLSPAGHEFLANVRKDTIWTKVKEVGEEIGSDSLKSLATIARQMVVQLIKSKLPFI